LNFYLSTAGRIRCQFFGDQEISGIRNPGILGIDIHRLYFHIDSQCNSFSRHFDCAFYNSMYRSIYDAIYLTDEVWKRCKINRLLKREGASSFCYRKLRDLWFQMDD